MGQAHDPALHCCPSGQTVPHAPQLFVSVCSSVQKVGDDTGHALPPAGHETWTTWSSVVDAMRLLPATTYDALAVIVSTPVVRALVDTEAVAPESATGAPSGVLSLLVNVTVPLVGTGDIVAVRVTDAPGSAGFADEVSVIVVPRKTTVFDPCNDSTGSLAWPPYSQKYPSTPPLVGRSFQNPFVPPLP